MLRIKDSEKKCKTTYAIGKELHISKNTAKNYMEQPARVHGRKGSRKGSKLDPYKPQLQVWMNQAIYNCEILLERMQALDYDGGKSILKDYVHPYRPARCTKFLCLS